MDMFNYWNSPEEDDEDLFAWRTGGQSLQGTSTSVWDRVAAREPVGVPRRRNFMERVIAPFEAPQQFLFSMTREVDKDGFQVSDIWRSMSHGAQYFNPFGNTQRIEEDEIRQILFGPDAEGAQRTLATSAVNLGISLLYDPLWMVPIAGAAKRAGMIGARTAGTIQRIADPGMLAFDAVGAGARGTSKVVGNLLKKAIGPDEAGKLSAKVRQTFLSKWSGVEPGAVEALGRMEMNQKEWTQRAAEIYREGRKLSPKAQNLVTRMLESNAVYTSRYLPEVPLRPKQRAEISNLLAEASAAGIDENLLWDVYSKANKLELDIIGNLVRTQHVDLRTAQEFAGRHLRRMYTVYDDPTFGLEKIERLAQANDPRLQQYMKDSYLFDRQALGRALDDINVGMADGTTVKIDGKNVDVSFPLNSTRFRASATATERAASTAARQNVKETRRIGVGEYFVRGEDGVHKFDTDAFLIDFGYYLNDNPLATLEDALEHVKIDMFKGRFDNPEFMAILGDYMAKGRTESLGVDSWENILRQGKASAGVNFRPYRERVERLAERENIPEFIRKEILGEPDSFLPRIVDDAVIATREIEIRDLFDTLAGARRVSSKVVDDLMAAGKDPEAFAQIIAREGFSGAETKHLTELIMKSDGDRASLEKLVAFGDSEWSSVGRTEVHTYQLPNAETLGTMAGRHVTPGLAAHLENVQRMMDIGMTRPEGIWQWMGDKMAALTSNFKFLKIVGDAGANFRDTVGSILQIDITGGTPFSVNNMRKAYNTASDWMGGRSNIYMDSARRIGYPLMEGGFTGAELQHLTRRGLQAEMRAAKQSKDWVEEGTNVYRRFQEAVGDGKKNVSNLYQFRENILRSYVYVSKYDELAERMARAGTDVLLPSVQDTIARQAAAITDRSLFNYADVPYAVQFARRYGIAPFLTFPFKSAPQLVDSLYNNPLRILKYDRVMNGWNEHWAGGPEAFAAEVQALPEHKRKAMVVRLPGEDKEGNPLYLDLSYFLPWYAVRDLVQDAAAPFNMFADPAAEIEDARGAIAGDMGMRSSIFTPIVVQLIQAFGANQDGLGRPIVDATDDTRTRFDKWGKYLYQFMAPPTFVGGTTADSVGRAMQAAARTNPEPMNWVNFIGTSIRTIGPTKGFNMGTEDVLNRYGERPTTRALVGQDEGSAATFGNSLASLFLNVSASDQRRQTRNERIATDMSNTELQRKIAQIRVNKNMPRAQKEAEINRLREIIRRNREIARENIARMRQ